jgi:hypothetical protein
MDREIIDGEAEFQILQQRGLLSFTETYDPARAEQYRAHRKANDQKIRLAERTTESRSVPKASKSVSHESRSIPKVSSPIEAAEPRSAANALKQRKPTVWIVSEFGAASALVILAAEKGTGKSSLCYALAAAISDGSKFLNQCETVQGKVLVWQADESEGDMFNKLAIMGIEASFDFVTNADVGWHGFDLDLLRDKIRRHSYSAVFIDSITTIFSQQGTRVNDTEYAYPIYDLRQLADEENCLIVCTDHLRKPETQRQQVDMNDIIGAGQKTAAVSDVWAVWRPKEPEFEDHFVLKCLGKRNCKQGTIWNLQGNEEDYSWTLHSVGAESLLPTVRIGYKQQILKLIYESNEWFTSKDFAGVLGCNERHARNLAKELFTETEIDRKRLPSGGGRCQYVYGPKLVV